MTTHRVFYRQGLAIVGLSLCLAAPALAQTDTQNQNAVTNARAMSTSKIDETPTSKPAAPKPGIRVTSQSVVGHKLLVRVADLSEDGWIVIHYLNENGEVSGDPIGKLHLQAGHYENIIIGLSAPVEPGNTLVAMLHTDGPGNDRTYGESADHAVMKTPSGQPASARFKITQPADKQRQNTATGSGHLGNTEQDQSMH